MREQNKRNEKGIIVIFHDIKTYLVVYEYDNHIWDLITQADNTYEAKQKLYDRFKINASDVENSIVRELTKEELKDINQDWIDEYVQEWKIKTFK